MMNNKKLTTPPSRSLRGLKAYIFAAALFALFAGIAATNANAQTSTPAKPDEPKKEEASPLIASWEVTISAPGQDMPGTLKLEKDGDTHFKGSVITDLGEAPMKNIKITGDTFAAEITVNAQGQTMEGTITGKLAAGKLTGEIDLAGLGAIPYAGKKPDPPK